jgi:DNA invertase Pin-like site-specific DNA recombinase
LITFSFFCCRNPAQNHQMIYGYARVSTDGHSVDAQVKRLRAAGAAKVYRETASGARTERAQLRRVLDQLDAGDLLLVTRLDRLARSTRDLLNTLAAIAGREAGFRSLGDAWADTTTSHGRLMVTVLGGLAEFERELIRMRTHEGRARQGQWRQARPQAGPQPSPAARSDQAPRRRRSHARHRAQLQRQPQHDFEIDQLTGLRPHYPSNRTRLARQETSPMGHWTKPLAR